MEVGSGYVSLLSSDSEVDFFAEEFEDILISDFQFWDSAGNVLMIGPRMGGARVEPRDVTGLSAALTSYLETSGADADTSRELRKILAHL